MPERRAMQTDHRKGLAITFAGGMLLTFDVPFLKLAQSDPWTVMFVRGLMLSGVLCLYWLWRRLARGRREPFIDGWDSFAVGVLYGLANVMFILSIHRTTIANVVFILAFGPMFAALIARVALGQRIDRATWLAIVLTLAGVLVIVWDGLGRGSLLGDGLALAVAFTLATSLTLIRHSGKNMSWTPAFGALISVAFAALLAQPLTLSPAGWGWLLVNGVLIMPLATALLSIGPRYISAPEVAMFFLLETVLTPVWMWLVFGETPTFWVLAGGGVVIATLAVHSAIKLASGRPVVG
jgi:drug/metabolite transporter (DMT)-like permease